MVPIKRRGSATSSTAVRHSFAAVQGNQSAMGGDSDTEIPVRLRGLRWANSGKPWTAIES